MAAESTGPESRGPSGPARIMIDRNTGFVAGSRLFVEVNAPLPWPAFELDHVKLIGAVESGCGICGLDELDVRLAGQSPANRCAPRRQAEHQ